MIRRTVIAVLLFCMVSAASATDYYWNNVNDSWDTASAWIGGSAPVSSIDNVLWFTNSNTTAAYAASNNIATPFYLNSLILSNANAAVTMILASNQVDFITGSGAVEPSISMLSSGRFNVLIPVALSNTVTFSGTGTGTFNLIGDISGPGGLIKTNSGPVFLKGSNTFAGGVAVWVNTLTVSNVLANGSSSSTVNGGTLTLASPSCYAGSILINGGTLVLSATNAFSGALSMNSGTLTVNETNAYTGSSSFTTPSGSTINYNVLGGYALGSGMISVGGTLTPGIGYYSFYGVTNFTMLPGSTLVLANNNVPFWNRWETNRVVIVTNATVQWIGKNSTNNVLYTGTNMVSGAGTLSFTTGNGHMEYIPTNIFRQANGTLYIAGGKTLVATNTVANDSALRILISTLTDLGSEAAANTNGMALVNGSVSPWLVNSTTANWLYYSNSVSGTGLVDVVYSANTVSNCVATDLLNITGAQTMTNDGSCFALKVVADVNGEYNLTNGSGGVILAAKKIVPNLIFGTNEAVFYMSGNGSITGQAQGSGGLTKFGSTSLNIGANLAISGLISINAGTITVNNRTSFGNMTNNLDMWLNTMLVCPTNPLIFGGLNSYASGAVITNNATAITGMRNVSFLPTGTNTFSGSIGGTINLTFDGGGTQVLNGTNAWQGTTTVTNGWLVNNGLLGNTNGIITVTTNGTYAGVGTTTRAVTVNGGGTLTPCYGGAIGTMTMSNLTMSAGSTLYWCLSGSSSDLIRITNGNASLAGNIIVNEMVAHVNTNYLALATPNGTITTNGATMLTGNWSYRLVGNTNLWFDYSSGTGAPPVTVSTVNLNLIPGPSLIPGPNLGDSL